MYLLVLYLPLISAFLTGFGGIFLGKKGAQIINICAMALTFMVSCLIFYEVALLKYTCTINFCKWFSLGLIDVDLEFLFDTITATMLFAVSFVSLLVHVYSWDYMGSDPHFIRFMTYLTLFTFFMFVLVTSGNLVQFFVGWEGVGLASYLLINFWFTRTQANTSALKAMIVNRFGDFGLYCGIILLFVLFKTTNFYLIFSLVNTAHNIVWHFNYWFISFDISCLTVACLLLFLGAVGKSAQVGLHIWLPDAMEGPTPVSALIHAATMVTAGVFLLIRMSPILEHSTITLFIITCFGALTAFISASIGLLQKDLKKVIAYSTCSQLGYMVFACGLSQYNAGFFHLVNHAFFKALLFLCAGSVIHALMNEQDIRRMGGLASILPITYVLMLIGSLSLLGFPFLTGFYSKDIILELSYSSYTANGSFAYILGMLSVGFTAFYSFRLLHLTFFGKPKAIRAVVEHAHEAPRFMLSALIPLAFGSIFWGYITKDMFMGLGSDFWQNSVFILPQHYIAIESEFISLFYKHLPVMISLACIALSFRIYAKTSKTNFFDKSSKYLVGFRFFKKLQFFLTKKWYFDLIYTKYIVNAYWRFSYYKTFKLVDRGALEMFGPLGIIRVFNSLSQVLTRLHSGLIYNYIFFIILALFSYFLLVFGTSFFFSSMFYKVPLSSLINLHNNGFFIIPLSFVSFLFYYTVGSRLIAANSLRAFIRLLYIFIVFFRRTVKRKLKALKSGV